MVCQRCKTRKLSRAWPLPEKHPSFFRMFKKVKGEGKARCGSLKMVAKKERHISAWLGGSIVASMGGYEEQLITVDEASAARKKRNSCSLGETDLTNYLCLFAVRRGRTGERTQTECPGQ